MLNDFTTENGATLYIPSSHFRRDIPERNRNYKCKKILGKAGTIVIFDSGLIFYYIYPNTWSTYLKLFQNDFDINLLIIS